MYTVPIFWHWSRGEVVQVERFGVAEAEASEPEPEDAVFPGPVARLPMTAPVFALLIDAEAERGCDYPEGERHHLLVLVPANSAEDATTGAMLALADCKWSHGEVRQVERFGVPLASVADPVLREAAEKAFSGSRSIIVYGKP